MYDKEFHIHLSNFPQWNWSIILQQVWSMYLKDKISKDEKHFHAGQGEKSSEICRRYNKGKHIVLYKAAKQQARRAMMNYLDNFLFIAEQLLACNCLIQQFIDICSSIGVLIAFEKTEWANTQLIFLGMLLDGKLMIIAIPEDKRSKAIHLLRLMKDKKKSTVKVEALYGYLNFLNKAIYPGRVFTRQMYSKYSQITEKQPKMDMMTRMLSS